MKALKIIIGALAFVLAQPTIAQTRPGSLRGMITDASSGEPLPYANIVVWVGETAIVAGGTSDIDGKYNINPVKPGEYRVKANMVGYAPVTIEKVVITANTPTLLNIKLREQTEMLEEVVIEYERPLIDKTKSSKVTTSEDIVSMPVREVHSTAGSAAGVTAEHAPPAIRGSRSEGSVYFIDGVKVRSEAELPQASIASFALQDNTKVLLGQAPDPLNQFGIFNVHEDISREKPREPAPADEARSGVLTAGEISDFSKWDLWEDVSKNKLDEWSEHWGMKPLQRYSVQVSFAGGTPVTNARAILKSGENTLWESRTDNTGKAELWLEAFAGSESASSLKLLVEHDGQTYPLKDAHDFSDGINQLVIAEPCENVQHIDIGFMVDATGSMADEIRYLQKELEDIISRVKRQLSNSKLRLGSVFYRDAGDAYVTRVQPLTADIEEVNTFLNNQSADGGGDYPEAVIEGLEASINELKWRDEAAARLLFVILDAPPHHNTENLQKLQRLMHLASAKGIRIIPIAASGIDKSTEYLMRSMALLTNGTYTFLTDDSGVGNAHIKPTTDDFEVELLNDLLQRLIYQFTYLPACRETTTASTPADSSQIPDKGSTVEVRDPEFEWSYYPNPTRDILNLRTSEKVKDIFVTDLSGKIVIRHRCHSREESIDLSGFPVGTYFLRFENDEQWHKARILKI